MGNLYVVDGPREAVLAFDGSGKFLREWGPAADLAQRVEHPVGVTVDCWGRILIAEPWKYRTSSV